MCPTESYEFMGRVPNVVFPCGAIADYEQDRLRIYYGAADTCIGLATGCLSEIVELCLRNGK
jgi:beta-1,4-mannooligosaccharide/beta-1,4-mannosyl-N-acetylglucosamine phosphorylase